MVHAEAIQLGGRASLPEPASVWFGRLLSGQFDSQYIELEGLVHEVVKIPDHWMIRLGSGQHEFSLFLPAEAKADFLARMSHDLRSPLSSAIGFADLIAERTESAPIRRYAEKILESGQRVLGRIEQILTAARVGEEEGGRPKTLVDLSELARQQVRQFEMAARQKGLDLQLEAPEAVIVEGSEEAIARIGENLIRNAIAYTEAGRVTVRAYPSEESGVFAVIDTGPGIESEAQERIFEAFEQGGSSEGVGLGLAIASDLTDELGGTISLEIQPGPESYFSVRLPFPPDASVPAASTTDT